MGCGGLCTAFCRSVSRRAGVGGSIAFMVVTATLAKALGFPVLERQEKVIIDGFQGGQGLEAADGLFGVLGRQSSNGMKWVILGRGWWWMARKNGGRKEYTEDGGWEPWECSGEHRDITSAGARATVDSAEVDYVLFSSRFLFPS